MMKFGLIGVGRIGKRHIEVIKHQEGAELVAFCDIKSKEELELADVEDYRFYSDHQEMLSQESLDVVSIASPNGLHEQHSIDVLKHGVHAIIEKPMALTKEGCERIIHLALQRSRQVFCVMQNRYSPPSVWLKEMVGSGKLGKIYFVQINCFWNRGESYYERSAWKGTKELDGGTLFTQFSHFLDIMYWVFGDIHSIQAQTLTNKHFDYTEFEDSGAASFQFYNGGLGSLSFSTAAYQSNLESSMRIIAENGSIIIGGQYMNEVSYCNIKDYDFEPLPEGNTPNMYGEYRGSAANHHLVYENVMNTLKGNESATTNALEGMKVVEIIEKIYQAAK